MTSVSPGLYSDLLETAWLSFFTFEFHKIAFFGSDFVFHPALLIQKVQDTQFGLNEINDRLVITEVDHCPGDPFFRIFFLV